MNPLISVGSMTVIFYELYIIRLVHRGPQILLKSQKLKNTPSFFSFERGGRERQGREMGGGAQGTGELTLHRATLMHAPVAATGTMSWGGWME